MEKSVTVLNKSIPVVEKIKKTEYTTQVSIVSMVDATVKVTGTVTGKQYVWNGAGSIVSVDILDKDEILDKKRGRACCGGQSGTNLFALV
jgi:hypothetical protein